jgi:hypothetical protein
MKRSLYLLTLLASLLLTGITAAAAPPFPIHPVTPITFCGTACLKNPPPAPYATVTNFQASLPMEWTNSNLDGPCTDPNHFNCDPNVPVLTVSFTTKVTAKPIVWLGVGAPVDAGYFPQGVGIALLQVDAQPTTQHSWTIYPAQHAYQVFQESVGHWPPSSQYWDQGWAVIIGYDPNNPNAAPLDDKLFA